MKHDGWSVMEYSIILYYTMVTRDTYQQQENVTYPEGGHQNNEQTP